MASIVGSPQAGPEISNTSPTASRLAGGLMWTLAGTAASRGALFLASLIVARILGPTVFGEFGVVDSTIGMFAIFGGLGLSLTSTKFVARYHQADPVRAGRVLSLSLLLSVISGAVVALGLAIGAPWLARNILAAEQLAPELQIGSAILYLVAVNGTLSGAVFGFQDFLSLARINFALGVITLPILIGGTLSAGLRGAVVGLLIIQVVHAIQLYLAVRRIAAVHGLRLSWPGCWDDRGTLLSFSIPAWINSSLVAPVNWLCAALLVNLGGGYSEMGLFQVANGWFLILLFVPSRLSQVYFPMLETMLSQGREDEAVRFVWRLFKLVAPVSLGIAACLTLCSGFVLRFYGPQYTDAHGALLATIWTAALVAAHHPLGVFLIAKSRMWHVLNCSIARAIVNVSGTFALCGMGATGMATARLLAYVCYVALICWLATRLLASASSHENAASDHNAIEERRIAA